jgi:hypothetical protein
MAWQKLAGVSAASLAKKRHGSSRKWRPKSEEKAKIMKLGEAYRKENNVENVA